MLQARAPSIVDRDAWIVQPRRPVAAPDGPVAGQARSLEGPVHRRAARGRALQHHRRPVVSPSAPFAGPFPVIPDPVAAVARPAARVAPPSSPLGPRDAPLASNPGDHRDTLTVLSPHHTCSREWSLAVRPWSPTARPYQGRRAPAVRQPATAGLRRPTLRRIGMLRPALRLRRVLLNLSKEAA